MNRPATADASPATDPSIEASAVIQEQEVELEREGPSLGPPSPSPETASPPPIRMPAPPRERRYDGPRIGFAPAPVGPAQAAAEGEDPTVERGTTAPQLRRFIKSRAYVPMHELRRRFAINGGDDDVTVVELDRQRVYVGLPEREGRLLGELLRGGDIGYELSLDPISPIVVGVYPMRPVPRT